MVSGLVWISLAFSIQFMRASEIIVYKTVYAITSPFFYHLFGDLLFYLLVAIALFKLRNWKLFNLPNRVATME